MTQNFIPENYNENSYAHAIAGGIISNVDSFYNWFERIRDRICARHLKRGTTPNQIELANSFVWTEIIREAHRELTSDGEGWQREKGDTWCTRLWLADYVIEHLEWLKKKESAN